MVLFVSTAFSQTMWCPKSGIAGFEDLAEKAKRNLGSSTSDLQKMEVYVSVKGDYLYLHSNYQPVGAEHPFKLSTNEKDYDLESWAKYLIDPDAFKEENEEFNSAYRDKMVFYIDPAVLTHPQYKNLDWGEAKNLKLVEDEGNLDLEIIPYTKKRVVKVHENIYIELNTEDGCKIAGQISKLKDLIEKLASDTNIISQEAISTNSSDDQVQASTKQTTYAEFFGKAASSGLTLINLTCEPAETIKDLAFDAFKDAGSAEGEKKLGEIKIQIPQEPVAAPSTQTGNTSITQNYDDASSDTGISKVWYFVIGIILILVIGSVIKKA